MAKVRKEQCKSHSRSHRATPSLLSCARNNLKDVNVKKSSNAVEKKDWEDAMCSVCMEVPHNAILLLCSSYNKGCRPYMCATSHRYSNCFEQYKKTYTKAISARSLQLDTDHSNFELSTGEPDDNTEVSELLCPLCRRQVKGWTVVEAARESLNAKKRSCVKDDCSFVGNYKQLRKHVRSKHPFSRPREVDPIRKEKWKRLECENERNDVISTILSSTPGAMVLGDYVLEPNNHTFYGGEYDSGNLEDDFFDMSSFNNFRLHRVVPRNSAVVAGRPFHRLLLGRARRGRRHGTLSSGR